MSRFWCEAHRCSLEEPAVLPGDVFHSASDRFLGRAIRWATSDRGRRAKKSGEYAAAQINHSGVVVEAAASIHDAMVVEAVGKVRHVRLGELYSATDRVTVWRSRNIPQVDLDAIVQLALADVGRRYPYGQLVLHLADAIIPGRPRVFRRFAGLLSGNYVCSGSGGVWFAKRGYTFGSSDAASLSPDDMHDYQRRNPHHWWEVRSLSPLGTLPGAS